MADKRTLTAKVADIVDRCLPKPKASAGSTLQKSVNVFKAQKEVIELLVEHPVHAQDIRDTFRDLVAHATKVKEQGENRLKDSVVTAGDVEPEWWKAWLVRRGLPQRRVDKIHGEDPDGLRQCWTFALKSTACFRLGDLCGEKAVLDGTATLRAENTDANRLELLCKIV